MARKRRNHFIPRMLQKHFASRSQGDKRFIYRYAPEERCLELSTKDAGVGKDFYGEDDDELENKFATLEATHSSILSAIVSGTFDFHVRGRALADIVWLLAMRTETNRTMLGQTVDTMFDEMARQSLSEEATRALLVQGDTAFEETLGEILTSLSPEQQRAILRPEKLAEIAKIKRDYEAFVKNGGAASFFNQMLTMVRSDAKEQARIKHSHNRGLDKFITKGARCPENKTPDTWSVLTASGKDAFVLGDACVFARDKSGRLGTFIGTQALDQIYFPVSPSITVVGHFGQPQKLLTAAEVTETSIAISSRYVFADRACETIQASVDASLGSLSYLIDPSEMTNMVRDVWK